MSRQRSRRRMQTEDVPQSRGELFIQILVCIAIICCFMFFKDTPLPNGKTAAGYAKHFLEYTVNFDGIMARFKDESIPVGGGEIEEASPEVTATPEAEGESE